MLFENIDETEREEFFSGLQEFRRREPSPVVEQEFTKWVTSWMVSIRLHMDEEYQRQRKESLARFNRGESGEVVSVEGLRQRFST